MIEGGHAVIIWLTGILNTVIDLEVVPDSLKCRVVVLFYKGGERDPQRCDIVLCGVKDVEILSAGVTPV